MTQPRHRPPRQNFLIHAGSVAEAAVLPEWWGALDSDTESRSLRFSENGGNWIDEDELPAPLVAAGCRLSEVIGVEDHLGLADPDLSVGQKVLLKPMPSDAQGHRAILVLVADGTQSVGYLPKDVAEETMDESHRLRSAYAAVVAAEVRDAASHERQGVALLIGPGSIWAEETS